MKKNGPLNNPQFQKDLPDILVELEKLENFSASLQRMAAKNGLKNCYNTVQNKPSGV